MKANRLLTVTVAVLGAVWCLADELDDLFPKSNKVVADGNGVKITSSELDAAVMFSLMNSAAEDVPITAEMKSLEEQLLHELVFSRLAAMRATQNDRSQAYTHAKETYNNQKRPANAGRFFHRC